MRKWQGNKAAVLILAAVIIIETALIIYLLASRPKKITKKPPEVKGKIAIVIDDWGYNLNNLYILDQIKYPLTMSILPDLAYSRTIAAMLNKRGIEIILHLPMEPREKFRLEKNTILITMDGPTIREIVNRDLDDISYAKGASNHMGSKATEDSRTMAIVFEELKKRNLFFLDSFVSPKTICFPLARKVRIGFARRDVFLDNKEEPGYIRQQIYKLKVRAKICGEAIGIGHDRQVTLEVLKEVMPELEKEGYRFVFVSELLK